MRPKLHFCPAYGWMNDPNGFCYYKGEFHLFYQHNPKSVVWNDICWGHAKSRDLIRWEHLPVAFGTGEKYDAGGCFSGTAIDDDGMMKILYTGQSYYTENGNTYQREEQALVIGDGKNFSKYKGNPVIKETSLPSDIWKYDFRDPYLLKKDGVYFALVGTRNASGGGNVVMYSSADLKEWKYIGKLFDGQTFGQCYECPSLIGRGGKDILIVSVCVFKSEKFPNRNNNVYFKGKLNFETGKFENCEGPFPLDRGFDFYAAETAEANGEIYMIAWMSMQGRRSVTEKYGFSSLCTLPRKLEFDENGDLLQFPLSLPSVGKAKKTVVAANSEVNETAELPYSVSVGARGEERDFSLTVGNSGKGLKITVRGDEITLDNGDYAEDFGYFENEESPVRKFFCGGELNFTVIVDAWSVEIFERGGKFACSAAIAEPVPEKISAINRGRVPVETEITRFS